MLRESVEASDEVVAGFEMLWKDMSTRFFVTALLSRLELDRRVKTRVGPKHGSETFQRRISKIQSLGTAYQVGMVEAIQIFLLAFLLSSKIPQQANILEISYWCIFFSV